MTFVLSLPIKLLATVAAFGGIGVAVLPADVTAIHAVQKTPIAVQPASSFNNAPMSVEMISRAPGITPPAPAIVATETVTPRAELVQAAAVAPAEPDNLVVDHVNSAVNVRSSGQKGAPVLFVLPAGSQVHIADKDGGWIHVYADQGDGWIYSSFVGAHAQPMPSRTDTTLSSPKSIRVASTVPVYDTPGGDAVYEIEAGERIRILERDGGWARIATTTGDGGWVRVR